MHLYNDIQNLPQKILSFLYKHCDFSHKLMQNLHDKAMYILRDKNTKSMKYEDLRAAKCQTKTSRVSLLST